MVEKEDIRVGKTLDDYLTAISDMSMSSTINVSQPTKDSLKPFVKWVGGKRGIMKELTSRIPKMYNNYYEPFIGGGALLLELIPKNAFISDMNQELIISYLVIKNEIKDLMKTLDFHIEKHSEEYFYKVRENDKLENPIDISARFIYLNKTCFNGLYRVNQQGKFNAPSGKYTKDKVTLYDKNNLENLHKYLKNVDIKVQSFEKINPNKGDFVYFDPPYHKVFTQYTDKSFGHDDQVALANFVHTLSNKGVLIMLSNSDTDLIRELYSDFNIEIVDAPRYINCKADNRTGKEVVITNYETRWDNGKPKWQ